MEEHSRFWFARSSGDLHLWRRLPACAARASGSRGEHPSARRTPLPGVGRAVAVLTRFLGQDAPRAPASDEPGDHGARRRSMRKL